MESISLGGGYSGGQPLKFKKNTKEELYLNYGKVINST